MVIQPMPGTQLIPHPEGRELFAHVYGTICGRMTDLYDSGLRVPRAKREQASFLHEVEKQAMDCTFKILEPHNQSVAAVLTLFIPNFVFARVDHVVPENVVNTTKASTLICWDNVTHNMAKLPPVYTGLTIPMALEYVEARLQVELPHHRPLRDFFAGSDKLH